MKIAIDCRFIGKSGIGTYISNIADELVRNYPEHQYLFIIEKGKQHDKLCSNVMYIETEIEPFSIKELLCFPTKEINLCDAFFTPYINIPGGINIPIFSTIHDVIFLDVPNLTSALGGFFRKLYIGRAIRKSKAIFTVSEFSKKRIIYHFKTTKFIDITYSAISTTLKQFAAIHKQKRNGNYLIYVGNIKKHKGLKVLLDAYNNACKEGYGKRLIIVGDGNKIRTADRDVDDSIKGNDRISFTGFISNDDMYNLMQGADALILPSFYEGFGLTPLEALYLGTDVIISDIQVLKEIYGQLPVTYFKVGDSEDLKKKIIDNHEKVKSLDELRDKIDGLYNFKNITEKIIEKIIYFK